jgi:SAM-dependent methyltransferase
LLSATRPRTSVFGATGTARPYWVDVGFGNGGLVTTADEFGFDALGVDVRAAAVERLQASGYRAIHADFNGLELDAPVAVLSFCDALEHMPDPRSALRKAHAMLDADGLLYISLPNSETATWRQWELSNTNPYWGELEHYHNFSRTRLIELLQVHGFAVIDYYTSSRYYSCLEITARKR